MKRQPLISIFIPICNDYNSAKSENKKFINDAINSLLKQSYANFELIILTSKTQELYPEHIQKDHRIKLIDTGQKFGEELLAQAVTHASGEYYMIADGKGRWNQTYLETLVDYLLNHQEIDLCYANAYLIHNNDNVIGKFPNSTDAIYSYKFSPLSNLSRYLVNRNTVPVLFGLFRKEAFLDILFSENTNSTNNNPNYEHFISNIFIKKKQVNFIDRTLFYYLEKNHPTDQRINFAFLRSQFFLHNQILTTFYEQYKPSQNQLTFLRSVSLHGLFKSSEELSLWLQNQNEIAGINNDALKESARKYSENIKKAMIQFPKLGNFTSDSIDNIRFEPVLNRNLLKINLDYLQSLDLLLKVSGGSKLIDEIKKLTTNELQITEKEIAEIDINLKKIPDILIKDLGKGDNRKLDIKPKVSVITASMNLAYLVEETMHSIANQTYESFEHIVIDGGSTDGSVELIKKYPNIILISEKDTGYPDAFWKGLRLAKGEYILQCSISDGYASADWIKKCVEVLDDNHDVSLVWGHTCGLNENSQIVECGQSQFYYNEAPQREHMFYYWLKTGINQPETNLCVKKSVILKCYPSVEDCKKNVLDWQEFSFRFNSHGYLSLHLPIIANFSHVNHANKLGIELHQSGEYKKNTKNYQKKINYYTWKLILGLTKHTFIDSDGKILDIKFNRKKLIMNHLKYVVNENKKYLQPKKYFNYIKKWHYRKRKNQFISQI